MKSQPKQLLILLLSLTFVGCTPTAIYPSRTGTWTDLDQYPQGTDTSHYPIYVPQPLYPSKAAAEKVGGYALVEMTVSKQGTVSSVKLLEEHPMGWGFGRVSLSAAPRLLYRPKIVNEKTVEMQGVLYKFSYQIQP